VKFGKYDANISPSVEKPKRMWTGNEVNPATPKTF